MDLEDVLPAHGGYRKLKSFQLAQLVYDLTVRFCRKYVDSRSRTCDQMVQAARSGVQNIAEGSMASAASRQAEMKLTNVAKASLEELCLDYEDFLRHRGLPLWDKDDLRRGDLFARRCTSVEAVAEWARESHDAGCRAHRGDGQAGTTYPEIAANAVLLYIAVTCSLLDRQIMSQAEAFRANGGFSERLHRVRTEARRKTSRPNLP